MNVAVWLGMVMLQALMSGAVVSLIVSQQWGAMLATCFLLNVFWWKNMGERIERHQQWWAGYAYSVVVSVGTLIGAWWWR